MTKEQINAALEIFQELRKARVHLNDEQFAEVMLKLIEDSKEKAVRSIAEYLEKNGASHHASVIRRSYNVT